MKTDATPIARLLLYAALTSLTALSVDALLPGLRAIEMTLPAAPPLRPQHIITIFVFGMVFGELLIGPIADAVGRKPALIFGLLIYSSGTVLALSADSLSGVILGRFLQGIGVSGPKIATRAIIRDQFSGDAMARIMSFMFTLLMLVTLLAPMIGQAILSIYDWRGIFILYLGLAVVLGLWLVFGHPETLKPKDRIPFRIRSFLNNSCRILLHRRVMLLTLATGIIFGPQLFFISIAADLFFNLYAIDTAFPYYFATLAAGVAMATFLSGMLVRKLGAIRIVFLGLSAMLLISGLFLCISLSAQGTPDLALFLPCMFALFFALGLLFGNLSAIAMFPLGQLAGLGASLFASVSSLVGTLTATIGGLFYTGQTTTVSVTFLLSGIAALVMVKWALNSDMSPIQPAS